MERNRRKTLWLAGAGILAGFLLGLGIGYLFLPDADNTIAGAQSFAEQDEFIALIALAYEQTDDLDKANARLKMFDGSAEGEVVASVAERAINAGHSRMEVGALALLAADLGVVKTNLLPYLPTSTPTPVPPTNTPQSISPTPSTVPAPATTEAPTSTPEQPTATSIPDTPTLTPTLTPTPPPVAIASSAINVRSGPGVAYPVVAALNSDSSASIVGRNQGDNWWQIDLGNNALGWVSAEVINTQGETSNVPVITDVAPPPDTPTPSSPPTPTAPPKPSVEYVVKDVRLRAVGEHSQRCDSGDHNIFVTVVDPAGNRLDGVRVREVYTGVTHATGLQGKGPGSAEWDIYRGGGGALEVVDENGNRISEVTREMSADWPAFDMLNAAGYCACKPHPDAASCQSDLVSKRFFFAVGHYAYEVVFQRSY